MMSNNPGLCCMLKVRYAKRLGFVSLPDAVKSCETVEMAAAAVHRQVCCNEELGHNVNVQG